MSMGDMSHGSMSMGDMSHGSMSMGDASSSSDSMMMNSFFTASTPNVPLWFSGWTPQSAGATFGACVGLFALSVLVKFIEALRHQAHLAWSVTKWHDSGLATTSLEKNGEAQSTAGGSVFKPQKPAVPWSASRDVPRGVLAAIHAGLGFFLMLAVMTYNVYYFLAIILGHFAGEVAFGRWGSVHGGGHG